MALIEFYQLILESCIVSGAVKPPDERVPPYSSLYILKMQAIPEGEGVFFLLTSKTDTDQFQCFREYLIKMQK